MRFTGKILNVSRDRHGPWMVEIAGRYPGDPIDRFATHDRLCRILIIAYSAAARRVGESY